MYRVSLLLLSLTFVAATVGETRAEFQDFRALWMSRYEYSSSNPADVTTKIANAAGMGITDVLFQVRGRSDAYYNSNFEPRAQALSGSWDPLQTAINAGNQHGVKIHAWLNTMPLWQSSAAPNVFATPTHPFYNTNPSFRRFDINGTVENPLSPNGEYASYNPLLPEVHTHINNVVDDIVTNYDVAGVHLDYIRWIGGLNFDTLPHDSQSHTLFQQATGLDALNPSNAFAYREYIADRITDLVGSVKNTVDTAETVVGRTVDLSAAVWRDPDIAWNDRLQDYRTWLEGDLLDIAMPMIYLSSSNDNLFAPSLTKTLNIQSNTRIAPGLGAYLHTSSSGGVSLTVDQLDRLHDFGADGATFFSYSSFFGSSDPLAGDRRQAVIDYYDSLGATPSGELISITDFEQDEGYFNWSPTFSGSNIGIGAGTTATRVTTEAQAGIGSQEISIDGDPSSWLLRHVSGIGASSSASAPSGNLPIDATGFVGFWLKTIDPGITVRIALDDPGTADRGVAQAVIADGEWHLYQWDLEDDSQWEGWVTGDGFITGSTVTLDSIQFFGAGDATLYLDSVSHNPLGSLVPPTGDLNGDLKVDELDLAEWQSSYGSSYSGTDLLDWQRNFTGSNLASVATVPEPSCAALVLLGFLATCGMVSRR